MFFIVFFEKVQKFIGKVALILSLAHALVPTSDPEMMVLATPHVTSSKWLEVVQVEDVLVLSSDLRGTGVTQVVGIEVLVRQDWIEDSALAFDLETEGSWLFEDVEPTVGLTVSNGWYRLRLSLPDDAFTMGHGFVAAFDFGSVLPAGFDLEMLIDQVKPGGIVILDDIII